VSQDEHHALQVEIGYLKTGQEELKRDFKTLLESVKSIEVSLARKEGANKLVQGVLMFASATVAVVVAKIVG